ncbi:MAG: GLPGLI family protein [Sediminicola sp.]|jgi:GLPGLI family protein
MKQAITTFSIIAFTFLLSINLSAQEFQGKAYYFSKTTMDMSRWNRGGQMSEAQKKQMEARMKPWLEKTYILTFSKEESMFIEDEKLAGPVGGRAPSVWGSSFSAGPQYKNVKTKIFLQDQEFFGKQFLIKEEMKPLKWKMGTETKQIGQYTCFKATASRPSSEVNWTRSTRSTETGKDDKTKKTDSTKAGSIAQVEEKGEEEIEMLEIVAWYTPMVPVSQGPSEYWGLPGLILEVSAGNTTMLCSKIIMNPEEKTKIEAPEKGQVVTKKEYNEIITGKMQEMRDNRGRGSGRSGR